MPTENQTLNRRRGAPRGRASRTQRRRSRSPVQPNAVPKLKHGVDNNFQLFKKRILNAALREYGDVARLIDQGDYWMPEEIDQELFDLDNDPHGIHLSELKDQIKDRNREISRMKRNRPMFYAFMLDHLSHESLDAIKLEANWEDADDRKDPLALWQMIEDTHRVAAASRIPVVLKSEARRAYQAVGQSAFESIVKFKERFDALLDN